MARVRQPNAGPYIVSHRLTLVDRRWIEEECHTWKYATERMRALLIEGFQVKVSFA